MGEQDAPVSQFQSVVPGDQCVAMRYPLREVEGPSARDPTNRAATAAERPAR